MGPTADGFAKPDFVAPGKSVVSLRSPGSTIDAANPTARIGTDYFKGSGTSFSAAITSGTAALVLSRDRTLSPNQVKARLLRHAPHPPLGQPGAASWAASAWAASAWAASSWAASSWAGSSWAGSSWAGSSWAGSSWAGSSWAGSSWAGSSWAAAGWGDS